MRNLSDELRKAIYSAQTERVFVLLAELNHSSLANPLRFTSDGAETTHNGNVYTPMQFTLSLPSEGEGRPTSRVQIQNVHRDIVATLRALTSPPSFKMIVVLASSPDVIEGGPWNMTLAMTSYDEAFVTAELQGPSLIEEPYPGNTYNVTDYPGLSV